MSTELPDLPKAPDTGDSDVSRFLRSVRDHIRELRGFSGAKGARALTAADAVDGLAGPPGPAGPPGADGSSYTPDLTSPPMPSGVSVTAGLTYIHIETAAPSFTNGHGYARTIVYGAQWPSSDPTAPTFSAAVKVYEFVGQVGAMPTTTGTRWCLWLTWLTKDGIESATPQGGTNGNQGTTGKVGTSDLNDAIIEAAKLADGAVTAAKFTSGIEPVTIVSSVPGAKVTSTIFNTADGKLYRWSGSAYTKLIPTADLSGTVTDAQIAGMAAAKVTGTLTDSQLAAISAAKITGTISAGQIADGSISGTKFASGLEPVSVVATVPGSKSTNTVFCTGDGKLYRWNGTAYVASVPTADLTGTITTTQITDGAISTIKLAANAVTAAKIAAGTITSNEIAADTITAGNIAAGAITASELAAGAVTAGKIAANAVTATEIAAGSITAAKIAADTITSNEIATNAITAAEIAAGAVTTAKIAAGAVTANEIAANTITAAKIAAGTLTATELATDAVTAGKIAAGAVTANKLAANAIAVGTAAIQNGAIINAMIGDATIDSAKIATLAADKLTAGTGVIGGPLKSSNFSLGSAGWRLMPDGTAQLPAVAILGQLSAGQMNGKGLLIQNDYGSIILDARGSAIPPWVTALTNGNYGTPLLKPPTSSNTRQIRSLSTSGQLTLTVSSDDNSVSIGNTFSESSSVRLNVSSVPSTASTSFVDTGISVNVFNGSVITSYVFDLLVAGNSGIKIAFTVPMSSGYGQLYVFEDFPGPATVGIVSQTAAPSGTMTVSKTYTPDSKWVSVETLSRTRLRFTVHAWGTQSGATLSLQYASPDGSAAYILRADRYAVIPKVLVGSSQPAYALASGVYFTSASNGSWSASGTGVVQYVLTVNRDGTYSSITKVNGSTTNTRSGSWSNLGSSGGYYPGDYFNVRFDVAHGSTYPNATSPGSFTVVNDCVDAQLMSTTRTLTVTCNGPAADHFTVGVFFNGIGNSLAPTATDTFTINLDAS